MAVTGKFYPKCFTAAFDKLIDFNTDTIKGALCLNAAFDPADAVYTDISGEVAATGTYVTGGKTITGCSVTYTVANSWGVSRADNTAYLLGAVVRPATGNTYLYQASVAGTSTTGVPTWPTVVGTTVTDGTVTWTCVGQGIIVLDGVDMQWADSTITADSLVIYDDAGTKPLIAHVDFGQDIPSVNGPFDVTFSSIGIAAIFV